MKYYIDRERLEYMKLYNDSYSDIFFGVMYAFSKDVLEWFKWEQGE